jgi:hypothetical protein
MPKARPNFSAELIRRRMQVDEFTALARGDGKSISEANSVGSYGGDLPSRSENAYEVQRVGGGKRGEAAGRSLAPQ